jgi:hypothetical protein
MGGTSAEVPTLPDAALPAPQDASPPAPPPAPPVVSRAVDRAVGGATDEAANRGGDRAADRAVDRAVGQVVPGTRASDAERDAAIGELREHFAAGRMSHDTFLYRMNSALGARRQSELPPLFADLPARECRRGLLPAGLLPSGWLSPGWAGSVLNRVLGGLPGGAQGPESSRPAYGSAHARARGVTGWFSGTPGAPGRRQGDARGPRYAGVLPFPRGAATAFSIGRDPLCDLAIDDITVSRVHARLTRSADGWRLDDSGSTNGTRVNGWLVRGPVEVRAGDLVRFGDAEYTLAESASSPPLH